MKYRYNKGRRILLGVSAFLLAIVLTLAVQSCSPENETGTGKVGGTSHIDSVPGADTSSLERRIKLLTDQLNMSPKSWNIWYDRSLLWYEAGNTARAMLDIEKAIELHITNPDAYHTRGFFNYVQNKDEEALADFKRALDMGSENPETFYHMGQIYFFRKDLVEAMAAYDMAIALDSMEPTYYFARGFLQQEQNKFDVAIDEYNMALRRNPTFVKALLALHDIYLEVRKDPDRAYSFNERIMLVDSTHPVARFNQGNFFLQRANEITEEKRAPEFAVLLKVSISEYSKCLLRDPNMVQALYNRGYAWYLLEKYSEAIGDFSSVIELDPFNENAFFMKASIQEFRGDLAGALSNYQQAYRIEPKFQDAAEAVKELSTKVGAVRQDTSGG